MDDEVQPQSNEQRLHALLVRGLAGDALAYHAFLKDLSGHLRAFLRKRLARLPDEVEDLVQETLLAVHNQRHTYDPTQPLTSWVQSTAKYKWVDLLRRRACRELRNDVLDDELELGGGDESEAVAARIDVAALLERLPARQRVSIVHTKLHGLSVVETSRLTGMSESTVKMGVHRGLKTLAAMMRTRR